MLYKQIMSLVENDVKSNQCSAGDGFVQKKAISSVSKTKYMLFHKRLFEILQSFYITNVSVNDIHEQAMMSFCEIMKFDPAAKTYDKEKIARLREETGKSTYELLGQRTHYLKHKDAIDQKKTVQMRKMRAKAKQTREMTQIEQAVQQLELV